MKLSKGQILAIAGTGVLAVLVFMMPTTSPELKETKEVKVSSVDAAIDSAVALVQGGKAPMQGIFKLKEILAENPENTKVLTHLGVFAIQSGQYDKAIDRLKKVISINSALIEPYYYLGHAYANSGIKDKAITNFEKYKSLVDDQSAIEEVEKFIEELKK